MTAILIIVLILVVIFAVVILTGDDDGDGTEPAPDVTITEDAAGLLEDRAGESAVALVRPVT